MKTYLAVFSALPPKSMDVAYKVLRSGVHPRAMADFDKALQVVRIR
ncbi:hypothetical protein [Scytonema hofmannii]|nr:hypothetical protein [Scytonema hofmannii]